MRLRSSTVIRTRVPLFHQEEEAAWSRSAYMPLKSWHWGTEQKHPQTIAYAYAVKDVGFFVKMTSCEPQNQRRAEYTQRDEPVYEDSCMEVFLQPRDGDPRYINIEVNPNGAFLCQLGEERENRVFLRQLTPLAPLVKVSLDSSVWVVEIMIPLKLLRALYGEDFHFFQGQVMRGNFYKCGDKTWRPHWGAWSRVAENPPGFHNPERFGELTIGPSPFDPNQ
jgi:hypothetical protein